jgi:hypothetical protein
VQGSGDPVDLEISMAKAFLFFFVLTKINGMKKGVKGFSSVGFVAHLPIL